jgi:hypothetical protein
VWGGIGFVPQTFFRKELFSKIDRFGCVCCGECTVDERMLTTSHMAQIRRGIALTNGGNPGRAEIFALPPSLLTSHFSLFNSTHFPCSALSITARTIARL